MPATRSGSLSSSANRRYTPYGLLPHAIPPSLPPTYGITDLFDWANPTGRESSPADSSAQLSVSKWLDQLEQRSLLGSTRLHAPSSQTRLLVAENLSGARSVLSISSGTTSLPSQSSSASKFQLPANIPDHPSVPESSTITHTIIPLIPFPTSPSPANEAVPSVVPTSASPPVTGMALVGCVPPIPPAGTHTIISPVPAYNETTVYGDLQAQRLAQVTGSALKTPDRKSKRKDGVETPNAAQNKPKPLLKSRSPAKLIESSSRRRQVIESESESSSGEAKSPSPKPGSLMGSQVRPNPHLRMNSPGGDSGCHSSSSPVTDSSNDFSSGASSEGDTDAITATSETEDDEIEDDSEEDYESEENGNGQGDLRGRGNASGSKTGRREELRLLRNKFIDDCAQESKPKGRKIHGAKVAAAVVEGRWMGKDRGAVKIRKLASNGPCTWTCSGDGVGRQPLTNRNIGDIHFSPGWAGSNGYDYWICVLSPPMTTSESAPPHALRWSEVAEGQPHPMLKGYVLKPASGDRAPCWVKAQSYRAHNHRKNHSQ